MFVNIYVYLTFLSFIIYHLSSFLSFVYCCVLYVCASSAWEANKDLYLHICKPFCRCRVGLSGAVCGCWAGRAIQSTTCWECCRSTRATWRSWSDSVNLNLSTRRNKSRICSTTFYQGSSSSSSSSLSDHLSCTCYKWLVRKHKMHK